MLKCIKKGKGVDLFYIMTEYCEEFLNLDTIKLQKKKNEPGVPVKEQGWDWAVEE